MSYSTAKPALTGQSQNTSKAVYTQLTYLYQDASNYKQSEIVYLEGALSEEDLKLIESKLDEGRYFIPEQVGLPALQCRFHTGIDLEDDHVWHELLLPDDVTTTQAMTEGSVVRMKACELVEAFRSVTWDIAAAQARLESLASCLATPEHWL